MEQITIQKTETAREKPDQANLAFGKHFTDHMFIMDYTEGRGWHDPRIIPYGPLSFDPSTAVLHYGQATFEGLKAYKTREGNIQLFRPYANMHRMNISNDRICIPQIDEEFCVNALKELVLIDQDWIPEAEGTSLYLRPFVIATEAQLGVHPSRTYKFIIIMSPVGAYYPQGINPVSIYVEQNYVRTVKGGTGFAKTAGNYASSLKSQEEAEKKGFTQVLWLDGVEKKYIEEVGTMNVFFKIKGEIVTPALDGGSILAGITRDSTIQLLKHWGMPVNERKITIEELFTAEARGEMEEAFGTGTAAVISPIGELVYGGRKMIINDNKIGAVAQRLYDAITGIQNGSIADPFDWITRVK
ncbi:MAG: branched-chain amino acid aminotransferase [Syntrophomonadaceae bacterium]|jgi:branched-chain amino acid aminotransferase|nr:branched-chain amino acid aminotransferase [Syntrophomonadaceae bacterium]